MGVALLLMLGGAGAGVFGSLLGLGGGILIVPLLAFGFGLPLREAIGVSLVSVIATSGASAGVFLTRRVASLRLGMTLELFTAIGALIGALVAFAIPERVVALLFAALLAYIALTLFRALAVELRARTPAWPPAAARAADAATDAVAGTSGAAGTAGPIHVPPIGVAGSLLAGVMSALLGVGGGIVKVPLMHLGMGVPMRVATATSNLMIGITATSSAVVYLLRGGVDPYVAGPTIVGVFLGASAGSRLGHRVDLRLLRVVFLLVVLYTAWQMIGRALG